MQTLESAKGEPQERFSDRPGDWGRDAARWLGRRTGRLPLHELTKRMGGLDYTAAGVAVSRFSRRLAKDAKLAGMIARIEARLPNVEM